MYRAGIYDFLDCMYGKVRKGKKATKKEMKKYEKLADKYFGEERDHFDDMLRFIAYSSTKQKENIYF